METIQIWSIQTIGLYIHVWEKLKKYFNSIREISGVSHLFTYTTLMLNDSKRKNQSSRISPSSFFDGANRSKTIDIRSILSNLVHDFFIMQDKKKELGRQTQSRYYKSNFETKHIVFNTKPNGKLLRSNQNCCFCIRKSLDRTKNW